MAIVSPVSSLSDATIPQLKKAELIEEIVYMPAASRIMPVLTEVR